ncbi:unnamed protein product [Brassicogethes aeneus]|uniref:FP protein C-terminal domain-containing protein n=1 Tax=Brassicogethes aeneus TaxID=1431903 RepID=A0A9P0AZ42_BRAAE|nr:unnamed protein product [Brassicogethes aeneus]
MTRKIKEKGSPKSSKTSKTQKSVCNKCNTELKTECKFQCSDECNKWFCVGCTKLTKKQQKDVNDGKTTWICEDCESTIIEEEDEEEDDEESGDEVNDNPSLADLFKEMRGIRKSIEFMSSCFDNIKKENENLNAIIKTEKEENKKYKEKVEKLEKRVLDLEQEQRKNNLLLMNVPFEENENVTDKIAKILNKIGVINAEYSECMRLPKKGNIKNANTPILLKLKTNKIKEEIMKKKSNFGKLEASDCELPGTNTLFINEDLAPAKQLLFKKARDVKKENNFKFVWATNGKIFIRKKENDPAIQIQCEDDLFRLTRKKNVTMIQ